MNETKKKNENGEIGLANMWRREEKAIEGNRNK